VRPAGEAETAGVQVAEPSDETLPDQSVVEAPVHEESAEEERPGAAQRIEEREDDRHETLREERQFTPVRREPRDFKPAAPAAVAEAIEEVNQIIASLKQALDQMEEVLETLELAEVQKTADEREIQSLRQGLHQLDRRGPRERQEQQRQERENQEQHRSPEPRRRDDRRPQRNRPD
jgi:hypothetical protein